MSHPNKTHCPAGHPYDAENTIQRPNGAGVRCRACNAMRRQSVKYPQGKRLKGKIPTAMKRAGGLTQTESYIAFWSVIEAIKEELLAGREVQIDHFGTFYLKKINLHPLCHMTKGFFSKHVHKVKFDGGVFTCLKFRPSRGMKLALNPKTK